MEDIKWVENEAFQLLIKFVGNQISLENLKEIIKDLSKKGIKSEGEINDYILTQAGYQFLERSHGKTSEERKLIKARYETLKQNLE